MSDDPTDHGPEVPRIVTNDGATLTFDRVWIRKDGWVCGGNEDTERIRRYPPVAGQSGGGGAMSPAWRRRCPEGHASWRNRADGGIFCPKCDEHYDTTVDYGQHDEDSETIEGFNADS